MSSWSLNGAPDNPLLTWPSFDEIVWDELGKNGDHILLQQNQLKQTPWPSQNEERKKLHHGCPTDSDQPSFNVSSAINADIATSKDPQLKKRFGESCEENSCVNKLNSDEYDFQDDDGLCQNQEYDNNETMMGDSSGGFSLDTVGSSGRDFDLFVEHQEGAENDSLLEFGWDNKNSLEDMDKLFPDIAFPQALSEGGGIAWPSFPSGTPNMDQESCLSVELGGSVKGHDAKMEMVSCESQSHSLPMEAEEVKMQYLEKNDSNKPVHSNLERPLQEPTTLSTFVQESHPQEVELLHGSKKSQSGLEMKGVASEPRFQDVDHKPRHQKHIGKQSKRHAIRAKVPPSALYQPPHIGYDLSTNHGAFLSPNSPISSQNLPHQPPMFVGYLEPYLDPLKLLNADRKDMPPLMGTTMTPQEKLEKLRWRQKMQAKLAIEHQQKQLMNQNMLCDQNLVLIQSSGQFNGGDSSRNTADMNTKDEGDMEVQVLKQLQWTMDKIDDRKRICIRDALYRLANSAAKRRTSSHTRGDVSGVTTSNHRMPSSKRLLELNTAETETNSMDRSIANLLFHKQYYVAPPPLGNDSCSVMSLANSSMLQKSTLEAKNGTEVMNLQRASDALTRKIQSNDESSSLPSPKTSLHSSFNGIQHPQQPEKISKSKKMGLDAQVEGEGDSSIASLGDNQFCDTKTSFKAVVRLKEDSVLENFKPKIQVKDGIT